MTITASTIITIASLLTAVAVIIGFFCKLHNWYLKQEKQDEDIRRIKEQDIKRIKEEDTLICFGLSACLDGLTQLGANHTVSIAKEKLDKYLNQQAHQ